MAITVARIERGLTRGGRHGEEQRDGRSRERAECRVSADQTTDEAQCGPAARSRPADCCRAGPYSVGCSRSDGLLRIRRGTLGQLRTPPNELARYREPPL